jgi:hypothetical protein
MKIKVFKLSNNTLYIEEYEGDKPIRRMTWPAELYAGHNPDNGLVSISSHKLPTFGTISGNPEEIEIDGIPQTDGQAAAEELNGFIGNYSHGGGSGISVDEIKDALQDALNDTFDDVEYETEEI